MDPNNGYPPLGQAPAAPPQPTQQQYSSAPPPGANFAYNAAAPAFAMPPQPEAPGNYPQQQVMNPNLTHQQYYPPHGTSNPQHPHHHQQQQQYHPHHQQQQYTPQQQQYAQQQYTPQQQQQYIPQQQQQYAQQQYTPQQQQYIPQQQQQHYAQHAGARHHQQQQYSVHGRPQQPPPQQQYKQAPPPQPTAPARGPRPTQQPKTPGTGTGTGSKPTGTVQGAAKASAKNSKATPKTTAKTDKKTDTTPPTTTAPSPPTTTAPLKTDATTGTPPTVATTTAGPHTAQDSPPTIATTPADASTADTKASKDDDWETAADDDNMSANVGTTTGTEDTGTVLAEADEEDDDEPPIAKLNTGKQVVDERPHLNIVFIGHVDAGKSTTCGNILYLTEQVDKRTIEKYEKEAKEKNRESWLFAFIMDINDEERAKGKTVEVGRALFTTDNRRFTILDAPGHKTFVPNMISGAAQADVAVLIISARKGEFETGFEKGGQTREHAMLARTLGVNQIVVAINKMDDPTCNWDETRYRDIEKKLTPFLKGCGFNPAKDIYYIPISGLNGQNIKTAVSDPASPSYVPGASWYPATNPPLLDLLDSLPPPERSPTGPFRMPILEGYRDQGVIAPGKIESGTVNVNDTLMIMPGKVKVKVTGIVINETDVVAAPPGENVSLRLSGIEEDQLSKGSVVSSLNNLCPVVTRFKGQVMIVELLDHRPILTAGYNSVLHAHTLSEESTVMELLEGIDRATKKRKFKPKFVKSNTILTCIIEMLNGVCVETFATVPQLGRFTLRDEGKTIGVGKVLELLG